MRPRYLVFIRVWWLVTALAPQAALAQEPEGVVQAAIEAGNRRYIAAFAAADAEAVARVYDSQGARLSSGGEVARGRDAIVEAVGRFLDRVGPVRVRLETVDVWVDGDRAYETGIWSYTYSAADQERRTIGGRYVTHWRRQPDGTWLILADLGVPGTSLPEDWRAVQQ